ncbi:hypothetical protein N7G274_001715 [Stereocaulon virgatum]|uniref:Hemolysin-III channel protein Izh2 n=1 Tax=Stereocaulon virgatum TaxID=373712 RepID=A0ABR4AS13_9LECA
MRRSSWEEADLAPRRLSHTSSRLLESGYFTHVHTSSSSPLENDMATRRRLPPRAQTTPVQTLHSLLTAQDPDTTIRTRTPAGPFLLKFDELPSWQQDNHYILANYRPESHSYFRCFQSLFYLHNESVNIHSHLLGAFLFYFTSLSLYAFERYHISTTDVLAFSFYFVGAVACLGMSAAYHMIANHSPEVHRVGSQLDYVGIVALIFGSVVPSVYYGFHCEPILQKMYWAMISTIAIGCTIVSMNPKFRTPLWRPFRAGMFVGFGLSAVFPVLHGVYIYGVEKMQYSMGLYWVILQGFLYILGAGLYAARIPERLHPGRFDIWGSSHQIFHILILLAAMSQLMGLLTALHHARIFSPCR